jgi:hypothetical protein
VFDSRLSVHNLGKVRCGYKQGVVVSEASLEASYGDRIIGVVVALWVYK